MRYNLLEKHWIPVLGTDGKPGRTSIREALTQAGRIRQIAAPNPMDRVALLRLLLAVLQWCKSSATEEELARLRLVGAQGIPADWLTEKISTPGDPNVAFDLLNDGGGFYQDCTADGVKVAVTNLLHDLPSGSKIAHFRHMRDGREGMCLGCCALGLARWPCVASAGTAGAGQSMTASINGNAPAYSVPSGAHLLATLLITWPSGRATAGDAAVWEEATEDSKLGFLKGMTWRSRRIVLAPPDETGKRDLFSGSCCYCGEKTDRLVKWILFRPGWKRPSREPWTDDPHLLYVTRKDPRSAKLKNIIPSWPSPNDPLEEQAGIWRIVIEGLLQRSAGSSTSATKFNTTLLGTSQALYKHVGFHKASLPGLGPDMADLLLREIEWLKQLTWATVSARGNNWRDPPKGHYMVRALCAPGAKGYAIRSGLCAFSPVTENELEEVFQKLMRDLAAGGQMDSDSVKRVLEDWRHKACEIIGNHVGRVGDATVAGSALRRREAARRAEQALNQAFEKLAVSANKPPTPNVAAGGGRRKGSTV